jgi:circadian clock protein KaiC
MKKRSGHHEESIRQLWFDRSGVHLGEPLTQLRGVLSGTPIDLGGAAPPLALNSGDVA